MMYKLMRIILLCSTFLLILLKDVHASDDCSSYTIERITRSSILNSLLLNNEEGFECFLDLFTAIGEDSTSETLQSNLPSGNYRGIIRWFNGNPLFHFLSVFFWDGMTCAEGEGEEEDDGNVNCTITTSPFVPQGEADIGIVSVEENCPDFEFDDHPCIKIDFTGGPLPRIYNTRFDPSSGKFLNFVLITDEDGNSEGFFSDVNTLTPRD